MARKIEEPRDYLIDFKDRFQQNALMSLQRESLIKDIKNIRQEWGVPPLGFSYIFKVEESKQFINWLYEQKSDGYKKVTKTIKKYTSVCSQPKYFLERALWVHEATSDIYPLSLYMYDNLRTFHETIKEKPFPGIINYILFNKILIPEGNELQMSLEKCGKDIYTILRIGPNATMNDIRDYFPEIEAFQKTSQRYNKLRSRKSKLCQKGKKIIDFKQQIKDEIKNGAISNAYESPKDYTAVRMLDLADEMFGTDESVDNQQERNFKNIKIIANRYRRKIK